MFTCIEGETADELWLKVSEIFGTNSYELRSSRSGNTVELLHAALCIQSPRQRWIASRQPAINPAFALAEVVWIASGRRDSAFLNYFNRKLPHFAGSGIEYHGAYGFRLRHKLGTDQLRRAYEILNSAPHSRQVVLQIWDANSDLPDSQGVPAAPDIPCNICAMLKVRDGRLDWIQIMRSNDVFRGLPYNIVQFTTLHELMAGWLNLEMGHYHHLSDSLHIYEDTKQIVLDASRVPAPLNTDVLTEKYGDSMENIHLLEQAIERIIDVENSISDISQQFSSLKLPKAWGNIASVLFAEGCRIRGSDEAACLIMNHCSNELFRFLFERWSARFEGHSSLT